MIDFGLSLKFGLGGKDGEDEDESLVRRESEEQLVETSVVENLERLVDILEEDNHVLIVAEMPGIEPGDVDLEIHYDILALSAERGKKRYRKEVLLPRSLRKGKISKSGRNGVIEIKCSRC